MNNLKFANRILKKSLIVSTIGIAFLYTIAQIYLINYRLVLNTLFTDYDFSYKIAILVNLLPGTFTSMSTQSVLILVAIAILSGLNFSLIYLNYMRLPKKNFLLFLTGGSFLGLLSSSCPACGLPVLALIGLSSLIFFLPYHGLELSFISLALLLVSLYLLTRQNFCIKHSNSS